MDEKLKEVVKEIIGARKPFTGFRDGLYYSAFGNVQYIQHIQDGPYWKDTPENRLKALIAADKAKAGK